MGIMIKPSDLKYKYPKVAETRFQERPHAKWDSAGFSRDNLYDVIPMLESVMDELDRNDATTLHYLEDIMNRDMPLFISDRCEVFCFLAGSAREMLQHYETP